MGFKASGSRWTDDLFAWVRRHTNPCFNAFQSHVHAVSDARQLWPACNRLLSHLKYVNASQVAQSPDLPARMPLRRMLLIGRKCKFFQSNYLRISMCHRTNALKNEAVFLRDGACPAEPIGLRSPGCHAPPASGKIDAIHRRVGKSSVAKSQIISSN
jgi:hypothetical protein